MKASAAGSGGRPDAAERSIRTGYHTFLGAVERAMSRRMVTRTARTN
jgi:hypothetical protein